MIEVEHEFELHSTGDEIDPSELGDATYKVVETYIDTDALQGKVVFTHRIELHSTDDQLIADWPEDDDSS